MFGSRQTPLCAYTLSPTIPAASHFFFLSYAHYVPLEMILFILLHYFREMVHLDYKIIPTIIQRLLCQILITRD